MRSPTQALLWEIWRRHRRTIAAIVGLTATGGFLDFSERAVSTTGSSAASSPLIDLLVMMSFALLFGIFNYTESGGSHGLGRFPHRLFTLPVSSLRLVAVPVLAGVAAVELLYLAWMGSLSGGGTASLPFVATLLGALMVFYQTVLWTLERLGALRLVGAGAVAVMLFGIGLLPSFPPSPPPPWRSEGALGALVAGAAMIAFVLDWRHVARLRSGGGRSPRRLERLIASIAETMPARRRAFASPLAAHFWFEWRCSGLALPLLVGGVLFIGVGPVSWFVRDDAAGTVRLLLVAVATPIVLAIPVGMAFSRPSFWSEDLSVPAFVAVRPLADDDLVAIKVKVAIASAVVSWLLVLSFVGIWLSLWANLDSVSRFGIQLWAFHGRSVVAVYGIAALIAIAGMFLTWRFLVSRLWSGLSGRRPLFIASVMSVVLVGMAGLVFDAARLPGWLLEEPGRMAAAVWGASIAVTAKYGLAAYFWRRVAAAYVRQYLPVWLLGTTCFATLGILLWRVARVSPPLDMLDISRLQSLLVLCALLAVPVGRLGLARSSLTRNRHR